MSSNRELREQLDRIESKLDTLLGVATRGGPASKPTGRSTDDSYESLRDDTDSYESLRETTGMRRPSEGEGKFAVIYDHYRRFPEQNRRRTKVAQLIVDALTRAGFGATIVPWDDDAAKEGFRTNPDLSQYDGLFVFTLGDVRHDIMLSSSLRTAVEQSGVYWAYIALNNMTYEKTVIRYTGTVENNISKTIFFPLKIDGGPGNPGKVRESLNAIVETAQEMKEFF